MTSLRSRIFSLLTFCCLTAVPSVALAQAGAIAGTVTDAGTGAAVPNAQLRAVAADGTIPAAGISGDDGQYRLSNLAPGTYTVIVNRVGYQERRTPGVAVSAGATATVNIVLQPAALMLEGQVVTATRGRPERVLEAPASIVVVQTERVEERPTLQVADHVQDLPGVDVATTGLMTSNVVTRGFNNVFSGSLLSITDHRYTAVPSLRVNTPVLVPTTNEDIERIEVLLGPGAALYGPNAANGVMHVMTRSPLDFRGTTLSVGAGERSVLTASGRHAGILGERFGYKVAGQYMQGREWEFQDPAEVEARQANPALRERDFDLERYSGELRLDYRFTPNTSLIFNGGLTTAGNAIEMTGLGAAQAVDWTYSFYQARFFSGRFFAQAFLNQSDAGDTFLLRTGQGIVDKSRMMVGQFQHGFDLQDRAIFTYGLDLQRTEPRTEGTITGRNEDDDTIEEIGGYLHGEFRLSPRFDVVAAIRADNHNRIEDVIWSPRAGIVFKPTRTQNFRLTYNRAFSTPTTNNLFLDLRAGSIPYPAPLQAFDVRTLGVPEGGLRFRRDCAGMLCQRSPYAPDAGFIPALPNPFWQVVQGVMLQAGVPPAVVGSIPPPTPEQVGPRYRLFNPTARSFFEVPADFVTDIEQLKPTISTTYEAGYKGLLGARASLSIDVWVQNQRNFTGPLIVETPNVFFHRQQLEAYLTPHIGPQNAAAIAAAVGGIDGSTDPSTIGIALGTITPDHPLAASSDLLLTYRNFGEIDLWGSDIGIEAILTDRFTLLGSYSHVSDDFFPAAEIDGPSDLALNAPKSKASVGLRFADRPSGFSADTRVRYVAGFPMNSGVYVGDVPSYTVLDLNLAYRVPRLQGTLISLNIQNLLDERYRAFIGAPELGRMILGRVTYSF